MSATREIQYRYEKELIDDAEMNGVTVATFELIDQQDSGYIKAGTEDLPNPPSLRNPSNRVILNTSAYAEPNPVKKGEKAGGYTRIPIRHIYGVEEVRIDKQGNEITNPELDRIVFKNGRLIVVDEGVGRAMLKFMRLDSRNATNEKRIERVEAIYREIFPEKEKETFNEDAFLLGEAIDFIKGLTEKTAKGWSYDEYRIDGFCKLFNIAASSPGAKIQGLIATANVDPKGFLERARLFEETIHLEIGHGLKLNVIKFEDTSIQYVDKAKVILSHSNQLSQEDRVKLLAAHFNSLGGKEDYRLFITEMNFKKKVE